MPEGMPGGRAKGMPGGRAEGMPGGRAGTGSECASSV